MNPQSDGKVAQTVDRAVHSSYSDSQEDNCLSDIRQSLRRGFTETNFRAGRDVGYLNI